MQCVTGPRHLFPFHAIYVVVAMFLLFAPVAAQAVVCTTVSTGNWSDRNNWDCGRVPRSTDTVVIAHNFTLNRDYTTAGLTINTGITLTATNNDDLTVTGNIINNGTYTSNGERIYMTGAGSTISGNGSFVDTRLYIDALNVTLTAGSTMNFSADANIRVGRNNDASFTIAGTITDTGQPVGERILRLDDNNASAVTITGTLNTPNSFVEIQNGGTLTNNGMANILFLDGNGDNNTTWTQGPNSNLTMSQPAQGWQGAFNASASGNTVTYNGTSTPLTPTGGTYFNLDGTYFNSPGSCPHTFTVLGSDPCTPVPGGGSTTGSPSLCVNDTSIGTYAWSGLNNVGASDNQYAEASGRNSSVTNYLKCTGYNFNIPANAIIDGIVLVMEGRSERRRRFTDTYVHLVKADTILAAPNYATLTRLNSNTDLTITYGGMADLWGNTWTPAEINDPTFGAAFAAQRGPFNTTGRVFVDHLPITVYFHVPTTPLAYYAMDEGAWNGTIGEVINGNGPGNDGTAANGATTSLINPVDPANPGTCRYGQFDGIDDYVSLPASFPNLQSSFTISAWIRPDALGGDQRIFADDRNNSGGFAFSLDDPGNGRLRFFSRNISPVSLDTAVVIQQGQWQYVTAVHDANTKLRRIYVNGNLVASGTYTGNWGTDAGQATIGGEIDGSSEASARWRFQGGIDEMRIYDRALTPTEIQTDMNATHACAAQVHHYRVAHDGSALSCNPETVTIQACADADCTSFYTGGATGTFTDTGTNFTIPVNSSQVDVGIRNNAGGAIDLSALSNLNPAPNSATATCSDTTQNNANCLLTFHDSGFIFDVPDITSCATSPNITISAVRRDLASERCVPAFENRTEILKFWSEYIEPASGTNVVNVNGTDVAITSPGTNITLDFDANGQSTLNVTYPDAGEVQLNASFTGAIGTLEENLVMPGNDRFVTVPAKFIVSSGDTNAACTTGFADASCSVFKKAGESFNLTVEAACANDTVTPNFDTTAANTSSIALTHSVVAPTGGNAGILGQANIDIAAVDNGNLTVNNQTISEVGVFSVTASLDSYLGIPGTPAGTPLVTGTSTNIGRFIPARLVVTPNTPVLASTCTTGANPFTYLDQDTTFSTNPVLTVTAVNTSGVFTQNYGGSFWKLGTGLGNRSYADQVGATGFTSTLSAVAPTLAGDDDYNSTPPTLTVTGDLLNHTRPANSINAFDANVDLTIPAADLTDSDGVCIDDTVTICNTNPAASGNPADILISGITGTNLRYGIGYTTDVLEPSTTIPTPPTPPTTVILPITAQYIDTTGALATNTDDNNCSTVGYTVTHFGITSSVTAPAPVGSTTMVNGSGDLTVQLDSDPGDRGGYSLFTLTWPVGLPGPGSARAFFGAIPADTNFLYWNESR